MSEVVDPRFADWVIFKAEAKFNLDYEGIAHIESVKYNPKSASVQFEINFKNPAVGTRTVKIPFDTVGSLIGELNRWACLQLFGNPESSSAIPFSWFNETFEGVAKIVGYKLMNPTVLGIQIEILDLPEDLRTKFFTYALGSVTPLQSILGRWIYTYLNTPESRKFRIWR